MSSTQRRAHLKGCKSVISSNNRGILATPSGTVIPSIYHIFVTDSCISQVFLHRFDGVKGNVPTAIFFTALDQCTVHAIVAAMVVIVFLINPAGVAIFRFLVTPVHGIGAVNHKHHFRGLGRDYTVCLGGQGNVISAVPIVLCYLGQSDVKLLSFRYFRTVKSIIFVRRLQRTALTFRRRERRSRQQCQYHAQCQQH